MEAIFDFKDINRRMNRKPLVAAVESDTPSVKCTCPICVLRDMSMPQVYSAIDPAKKCSDQTAVSVYDLTNDSIKHYNITKFKGRLLSIDRYFEWQTD